MAGITETGFVAKTRPEIYNSMQEKMRTEVSPLWDDKTNNLINIYFNIVAEQLSEAWSGVLGTYDSNYPNSASDVNLDGLGALVGVTRRGTTRSFGSIEFTGLVGTVIPEDTVVVVSGTGERFGTTQALTLSSSSFSSISLTVSSVVADTLYSVTIDGDTYAIDSGSSPTASSILSLLETEINNASADYAAFKSDPTTLIIDVIEPDSVLPIVVGARLSVASVSNVVSIEATTNGEIRSPVGAITSLAIPIAGITSLTNRKDIIVGEDRETDNEFRVRRYESVAIIGASTIEAITARLRNVFGVTSAYVIENSSSSTDLDGRPSKSFEVVVQGGDLDDIATAIQITKPVGIETFGEISRTIIDSNGDTRVVNFSRPKPTYIHFTVQYVKYAEETLIASSVVQGIKDAIIAYGETLNMGVDIIPKRFFGNIYSSVSGIEDLIISVAKSYDGVSLESPFSESPLRLDRKEYPIFLPENISVSGG